MPDKKPAFVVIATYILLPIPCIVASQVL